MSRTPIDAEALRQSQSLPAGAVAGLVAEMLKFSSVLADDEGIAPDIVREWASSLQGITHDAEAFDSLRDSFRWNALLNRIDTASAKEFGTLLNIIGDARALGCGCLENYVDQIDVGERR